MKTIAVLILFSAVMTGQSMENSRSAIEQVLSSVEGTFGVAFEDLTTGTRLLIREREMFHAASTMKTPVMIEVYRQAGAGRFSMNDSLLVKNKFKSIVDGSAFSLDLGDDSDDAVYKLAGKRVSINDLVFQMITVSSNLATNLLIELVGASNVTATMRSLGADSLTVLRGVEDGKAFQAGLNNRTNAIDLLTVFRSIAQNEAADSGACRSMKNVLLQQRFHDIIPAQLPGDVRVAHKTGSITGILHDSGIVFLPDGRSYVLVLLSKGLSNTEKGKEALATVSRLLYEEMTRK